MELVTIQWSRNAHYADGHGATMRSSREGYIDQAILIARTADHNKFKRADLVKAQNVLNNIGLDRMADQIDLEMYDNDHAN